MCVVRAQAHTPLWCVFDRRIKQTCCGAVLLLLQNKLPKADEDDKWICAVSLCVDRDVVVFLFDVVNRVVEPAGKAFLWGGCFYTEHLGIGAV